MPPVRRFVLPAAGLALSAAFFLISRTAMAGKSATYDEGVHLLSGFRLLTESDHDFNHEHPPLMKLLAATPVVLAGAAKPLEPWAYRREVDEWPLSHDWLYHANDGDRLLSLGRLPIALLGACLALALFAVTWSAAGRETGPLAGVAAVSLFALEPNLLAHGSLITTDMGMTFFFFTTVAAFWRYLETRGTVWIVLAGLLWGAGLLAKFTSILVAPALLAMGAASIYLRGADRRLEAGLDTAGRKGRVKGKARATPPSSPWPRLLLSLAGAAALALLVLNLGYGFDRTFTSLAGMKVEGTKLRSLAGASIGSIPLPLPAPFVMGYGHAEAGGERWWSYLMGMHSMTGWRSYYLVALLVKTPIPLLALAGAGALLWRKVSGAGGSRRAILLGIPPVLLLSIFTLSGSLKNIGLRYVLPVYPFLCLFGGIGAAALAGTKRPYGTIVLAILLVWMAVGEWRIYPDHLAYFNEIAGGPEGGRWWLLDSNLDWGQDLPGLAAWMKDHGVAEIFLDYFGRACPRYYGIRTTRDFAGGWLAVSATNLGGVYREDRSRYDFLRGVEPVASIGHSILVYNAARPPEWKPLAGAAPD